MDQIPFLSTFLTGFFHGRTSINFTSSPLVCLIHCSQFPLLLGVSYGTCLPFPTYCFSFKPKIWVVTPGHWDSSLELLRKNGKFSSYNLTTCIALSKGYFYRCEKPETQHSKAPRHYKMLSETKKKQLGILHNLSLKLVWRLSDRRNVWSTSVLVFDGSGITWL